MAFLSRRRWWVGTITLVGVLGLLVLFAVASPPISQGSTYSRSPSGYGAWYAFMTQRSTPLQRWQRPLDHLPTPAILIRVKPPQDSEILLESWVKKGNTLILLGQPQPSTAANFESSLTSPQGLVAIATRRRHPVDPAEKMTLLLGDRHGAVVWQKVMGEGRLIQVTTPFLAANAYQDSPGNFEFLAQLVTQSDQPIWIDEYLHGYKDPKVVESELGVAHWGAYLARTPLYPLLWQSLVLLIALIWAGNQRLGAAIALPSPPVNNSDAYINALAAILDKANQQYFVRQAIAHQHYQSLLAHLGLDPSADRETIALCWQELTQSSDQPLRSLWRQGDQPKPLAQNEFKGWLRKWEKIQVICSNL
jgi:hypothetical protein